MMKGTSVALLILVLFTSHTIASTGKSLVNQERKGLVAVRTANPPRIDGDITEAAWQTAPIAGDFIQYSPFSGRKASFRTEVSLLYDDEALYIAATMYDQSPDSIYAHLGERDSDNNLNADHFYIDISTFNDGLNGETFKVSASGVQSDMKARASGTGSYGGGDRSWDAVWFSSVRITEGGWVAELKIPFSALRFPQKEVQTWGINFWREIRRYRELSSWNYVDREAGSNFNHLGELEGLQNLIPPVRLSLIPYLSGYVEKYDGDEPALTYNGGLDIKYGISESFTLDATLIPDFGQVQSDDKVLNLSPYEVKYNERRPFFMEGTELFNKGDIFYSRRIGSMPRGYYSVYDSMETNEEVTSNPQEASMINATKISGRTKSGLGIGVFNAMTRPMFASIENSTTAETRQIKTEPFTNYNMLVLDQSLKYGSYVSLSNTNVWRAAEKTENYYTANVTAVDFKLQNSSKMYTVSGKGSLSQKYYTDRSDAFGHSYDLSAGKTGGMFRFDYQISALSDTYDPNDLGYLRRNNEFQNSLNIAYNTFKPFWKIYTTRNSLTFSYNQLYSPRVFTGSSVSFNSMTIFSNYWSLSVRSEYKPVGEDDYYEPRIFGRYYHRPDELMLNIKFDTDKSKAFYLDMSTSATKLWSAFDQTNYSVSVSPEIKLSSHTTLGFDFDMEKRKNDIGYIAYNYADENIIFGRRYNTTMTGTLSAEHIFTANSYLTFRLRHYWARADYNGSFYYLEDNGQLIPGVYTENPDLNYNAFNIDMVYTWRFAPGSELTLVWKNTIYSGTTDIFYNYIDNIRNMLDSPMLNSLSLKVLYYLDYQSLRKRD
ncbi:MAG TPA: DUF5916 domain-containing protein [Bacteroidales bacterium]|nr:DUF5916 domain-containing protein [Bacteroidales bacterium]